MKWTDIFFQNIRLSGFLNDCAGLWFFGNFKDPMVDSLRIGFMLGFYDGTDYGIADIKGDPNIVTIRIEILTKEGLYTYIDQRFTKKDVFCNPQKLDFRIADNISIRQVNENKISWSMKDEKEIIHIDLELDLQHYCSYPEMVFPNNIIRFLLSPMVQVSGELSLGGKTQRVDGIGALDQYSSKKINSPTAKKYGYSFYEPIMWKEGFASVLYYIIDADGEEYLNDIVVVHEGQVHHLKVFDFQMHEIKDFEGSPFPSVYQVKSSNHDLEFIYEARIENRKKIKTWGYPDELIRMWVPNLPIISAEGILRNKKDSMKKDLISPGKGILEFLQVNKYIQED